MEGRTALHAAALSGRADIVALLLEERERLDVNQQCMAGYSGPTREPLVTCWADCTADSKWCR